jgi:hypothetical protein
MRPHNELNSWQKQEYWRQRCTREDLLMRRALDVAGRRATSFKVLPILQHQPVLKVGFLLVLKAAA